MLNPNQKGKPSSTSHLIILAALVWGMSPSVNAAIVDTGQSSCYDNTREIPCPRPGQPFYGQDAQYQGATSVYRDNGDGTVTDLNTGLMWSKAVDTRKVSLEEAKRIARSMTLGGHNDWRVPNIKELYTLIDFRGYTGFGRGGPTGGIPSNAVPFINTDFFDFRYGDTSQGERYIDAQWLSSTRYVSTTMGSEETLFGVNFADGRIKGYGYKHQGGGRVHKKFYVRYVRGDRYSQNHFVDNGDGTVTDTSSGLTWMQMDSGKAMNWEEALRYAEDLKLAGHDDWRLPSAKELQYIVDYTRSPDTTGSAAIDPIFQTTSITNEAGQKDYPFFWTSTTHLDGPRPGEMAAYVSFGRAIGQMRGRTMDVHGAGAQRSDPKTGRAELGHGPQGDARRVYNFVRVVRGGDVVAKNTPPSTDSSRYPNNVEGKWASDTSSARERPREDRGFGGMSMQPPSGGGFIQRLDKDWDGKVSRSEFDGPPDRFDFHDSNGDGYLSDDEAPRGPPPGRGGPPPGR